MNFSKRAFFVLLVLVGVIAVMEVVAAEPSEKVAEYVIGEKTYAVMPTSEAVKVAEAALASGTAPAPKEWLGVFFVQAAGPRNNDDLGQAGSKESPWRLLRALPYPGDPQSLSYGIHGFAVIFDRPLTRKWTNTGFPMTDFSVAGVSRNEDREWLVIEIMDGDASWSEEGFIKAFKKDGLSDRVCMPVGKQQASLTEGLYFNADRVARTTVQNISLRVRPNFSDVKSSDEFNQTPAQPPILVMAVAAIKEYFEQPFPKPDRIKHNGVRGKLIEDLAVSAEKVRVGQPVRVKISLGTAALLMPEIVRLKASSGGFQRKDGEIFYQSDKPGEVTIALEIMCGGHGNGVFDFAERKEITVVVAE